MGKRLKIGIIGCGTIGTEIARACQDRLKDRLTLCAVCDIDRSKAQELNRSLKKRVRILNLNEIIDKVDFIVEAASAAVSADILEKCIKNKKGCMVMSAGSLLGKERLLKLAEDKGLRVCIPSGALCGIDGLKAASVGRINSVTLITRKPPKGLAGAPYVKEHDIDMSNIKDETLIFEGSAEEAIKGFPQNVNVSAVLSLAGIGAKDTIVKIISSSHYNTNTHEIEIIGEFGKITTKAENIPSKTNPKTSTLAIYSAIATLEGAANSVRIGT